jgi:hypothetical protein
MPIILALSAEDPADAVYLWFRNRVAVIISHNKKLFLFLRVLSFFFFFSSSSSSSNINNRYSRCQWH